jgi:hypothetical protein
MPSIVVKKSQDKTEHILQHHSPSRIVCFGTSFAVHCALGAYSMLDFDALEGQWEAR